LSLARVSGRNEKTFRRHFARSVNFLALHRASIDEGLGRTPPGLRIIAFDPSFLPKAGKKTSGLGWFWNGSASRAAYGLEATVTAIVDVKSRNAMTLAIQQTIVPPKEKAPSETTTKKATKKSSTEPEELSRIDEYLRHIENVIPHLHIYAIHYPHHCDKKVVDCERITEASIGHTARIVVEHPSHHRTMAQSSWLNDEVFTANFGDKRLSNRFASIITAFAEKPNASIPQSAGSWKSSKATYNFFQTKK